MDGLDRYVVSTGKNGYGLGTNSANPTNSFLFITGDSFGFINKNNQNYTSPNWNQVSVKIVVTQNSGKYLVLGSQYATSNLTVNSNLDMQSSYVLDNLNDPTSA